MGPSIHYDLAMPHPETHLFEVTVTLKGFGGEQLTAALPVWAPGSYLVREFARHVQDFEARDGAGKALPWRKSRKNAWEVDHGGAKEVRLSYRVYANELSVQTSHLDVTHGYLNGTSVFLYVEGHKEMPHTLRVDPVPGWRVDTALPSVRGKRNTFRADDYDHLVDCPIEMGTHEVREFTSHGKRHRVAWYGKGNEDLDQVVADIKKIVDEEGNLFGGLPYDEYLFIYHLTNGKWGGLEHRTSTTIDCDRWTFKPKKEYERFLGITAHEFFHVWNVKRIRPLVLGPFNYDQENYTTLLWAMEGVTSYYDHLILVRTGLMTEERYLEYTAELIQKLRELPGRFKQSLEESSFNTWIHFYRPNENTPNTGVSYYLKGELVAMLLDLAIREKTEGKRSLDDVWRHLWDTYGKPDVGMPESGVEEAVEAVTGMSWRKWFNDHIRGKRDVDFETALARVGLDLTPVRKGEKKEGKKDEPTDMGPGASLGVTLKGEGSTVRLATVYTGSPAEKGGLSAGDEIVAFNGYRVNEESLKRRLNERKPGDRVLLTAFRRDELITVPVTLGPAPPEKWKLVRQPKLPARERKLLDAWVAPSARPARKGAARRSR
ncbi:MAG TPA: PDZ domain-containing protein [Candidatus Thermoplasmatota archaeon]|nr:PDZ domain-containing protein [Candidatus Thermoplasmatota archaeon]